MKELDAKQTNRAAAFELWMNAPMPMVTLFKTFDVTRLVTSSRKHGCKFNMLMCWCIGKAATQIPEFYLLPVGDKMIQYDSLAINTVVAAKDGTIHTCDIPFSQDLQQFNQEYQRLTHQVYDSCEDYETGTETMIIGTSALTQCEIDGAVNIYAGVYNNPFLIWGRYRKKWFKTLLPVSFQFHHTQMDGGHAARFLETLQQKIRNLHVH